VGLRARTLAATAVLAVLAPVLLAATGCSGQACGGQCGPPFQLQVVFRPGTSSQAAAAAMTHCAANSQVVRIGRVHNFHGPPDAEPPGSLTATVYTRLLWPRTRTSRQQQDRLFACLRQSPAVTSASFLD
jgi:hypothetical protein